jgi:hypothetical protein
MTAAKDGRQGASNSEGIEYLITFGAVEDCSIADIGIGSKPASNSS